MMLKDNQSIELPKFLNTSFSGMDILPTGSLNNLILEKVEETESSELKLTARIEGTQQQLSDSIKFLKEKRGLKDALYKWLSGQIGNTIDSIWRSEFSFEEGGK